MGRRLVFWRKLKPKKYRFTYFEEYTGPSIALTVPLDEKDLDLLNSTIVLNSQEELALPLHGKKNKLKKDDFCEYFAKERLGLTQKSIDQTVNRIVNVFPKWTDLIQKCFLSDSTKTEYLELLNMRFSNLDLANWG
jgi:hypothetical protein